MYALLPFGKGRAHRFFVNAYNESDSRCCRLLNADRARMPQSEAIPSLKLQQPLIRPSSCYSCRNMLLLARNLNDICVPEIGNWSASKVLLENGLIGD